MCIRDRLEIVPDYTLNENACTIETDAGIFDCGVDVQLDNLMKDINCLLYTSRCV